MSLRENSVCLMQLRKLAAEKACHRWSMLEGDRTGRSIPEFQNYLTVNHGLQDVAKKGCYVDFSNV